MCSVIILRQPQTSPWPLILAANRDEMRSRPWQPPARHWPDRADVVAGLDDLAGGTWLGLNDSGVVAAILNRKGTLGPQPGKRSRGELPLEALDHADASAAVAALLELNAEAWRPFNMVVADNRDAFWLRNTGARVEAFPIPLGVSMITAVDLNDQAEDARLAHFLPRFRAAPPPDPDAGNWAAWAQLLGCRDGTREAALCFMLDSGFGTSSSSLLALPSPERGASVQPQWHFAPGPPDVAPFAPLAL